jgi:hypothetical protein
MYGTNVDDIISLLSVNKDARFVVTVVIKDVDETSKNA